MDALVLPFRLRAWRAFAAAALPLAAGACSSLPSSGPTRLQVLSATQDDARLPATLIDLDATTLPEMRAPAVTAAGRPADLRADGDIDRVGPGDVLQVSVFEIGSTLFAPATAAGLSGTSAQPTAAGTTLPPIPVARDGSIVVPYAGRILAEGQTTQAIAQAILARLRGLSEHAQVQVAVRENMANAVFVLGGVKTPGRVPLSLVREHLLDAIALTGGTTGAPQDTTVRLTRRGQSAEIGLDELLAGSPDDVVLLPGDRIELLSRLQSFTVFGASDKVSEIPFQMRTLTLAQAVARAGGPSDRQADASAVFVFRWSTPPNGAAPTPIIYRLNLLRPESYFLSQRFAMRNGDVIYIANARSNQASKLVQIINQLFSPFFTFRELSR
ncbi:polysaccharide biosynthesis/export family protein [Sphingomonas sp. S2M10]|uniref:polysaccharide biosynthesis/export family protein n=1 Tax=Sphingomonas sp. S2M10 TaxID=2705010 RepID=UPI001456DC1F|nr:polysaccharide biosynthesis/export family protein [Sphingomonas sp. S2M10]